MPTDQKFVAKVDSRGIYNANLVFIGTENECWNFSRNKNNNNHKNGSYFTYYVRNFYIGQSIFIDNNHIGDFVENLTDYINESPEWRKTQLTNGPIGEHKFEGINCLHCKFYGRRKVFSIQHGSINQILVKNLTHDDLVWINV